MPTNLKDVVKRKIVFHLGLIVARYKILILDDQTKSLLLDCRLGLAEIAELGYYAVEQIDAFRKPLKDFEAVYLLSPSDTSIKFIRLEFEAKSSLYAAGHILMTSYVSDEMMEELGSILNGAYPLKRLDEINVQFIPIESQVFHLGLPDALVETYGAKSEEELDDAVNKISDKLMDFMLTIDDEIDIRYYDPSGKRATLSSRLAWNLQDRIEALRRMNPNALPAMPRIPYSSSAHDWRKSSIFVLMDRSLDLLSPLLHMLSFQALMHDLYEIREAVKEDEKHLVCDFDTNLAAVLDESDEIFGKVRHQFYLVAKRMIEQERLEHLLRRKEAKQDMKMDDSYDQIQEGFKRVMNLVLHKDEVIQRGNQIAALVQINKSTDDIIESAGMDRFFGLEQDLAVGETFDGEDVFEPFEEMMDLLNEENEEILPRDKLRIVLIYLLTIGGLPKEQLESLTKKAKFRQNDALVLQGLEKLGVILDLQRNPRVPLSPFTFQHRRKVEPLPASMTTAHEGDRFIPSIFFILRDIFLSRPATLRVFPSINEELHDFAQEEGGKKSKFLAPLTRRGGLETSEAKNIRYNGPRLILFITGGVTYAEIKVAYELTRLMQREAQPMSSPPAEFVEDLYTLGGHPPRHKENVPDDTEATDESETQAEPDQNIGASHPPTYKSHPWGMPGSRYLPNPRSASSLSSSSTSLYHLSAPTSEPAFYRRDSFAKRGPVAKQSNALKPTDKPQNEGGGGVFSSFGRMQDVDGETAAMWGEDEESRERAFTYEAKAYDDDESVYEDLASVTSVQDKPWKPKKDPPVAVLKPPRKKQPAEDKKEVEKPKRRLSAIHKMRQNSITSQDSWGTEDRAFEMARRGSLTSVTSWTFTTRKNSEVPNPRNTIESSVWGIDMNGDPPPLPPQEVLGLLAAGSPTMGMQSSYMDTDTPYIPELDEMSSFTAPPLPPHIHPIRRSSVVNPVRDSQSPTRPYTPIATTSFARNYGGVVRAEAPQGLVIHQPTTPSRISLLPSTAPRSPIQQQPLQQQPLPQPVDDWELAMKRMTMATPELLQFEKPQPSKHIQFQQRGPSSMRPPPSFDRSSPPSHAPSPIRKPPSPPRRPPSLMTTPTPNSDWELAMKRMTMATPESPSPSIEPFATTSVPLNPMVVMDSNVPPRKMDRIPTKVFYDSELLDKGTV
ncbi:Sec1-like protein [Chytridium lagenaria]|nr:Sec1-like protein [Chytridium lagenaria]